MSNRSIFLITILFLSSRIFYSQTTCFEDPWIIYHQYEIDNFHEWYPECIETGNNLIIYGDDITNLDGLQQLETINGSLEIIYCTQLTSVSGLDNIRELRHNLRIENNQSLLDFNGLNSLKEIGEGAYYFEIINNPSLKFISGFHSLEEADVSIAIINNQNLESISGFPVLKRLTNIFDPESGYGDLIIENNNKLGEINGFIKLDKIDGDLVIRENGLDSAMLQFPYLDSIMGSLVYNKNKHLKKISGFQNLKFIGSELQLFSNDSLSKVSGFSMMDTLSGNLFTYNNPMLAEIDAFRNLKVILGDAIFNRSESISSSESFNALQKIKGDFKLVDQFKMERISGFTALDSVFGKLIITGNDSLSMLFADYDLKYLGGSLELGSNKSLKQLSGLNQLDSIGGRLFIQLNTSLENLNGLDSLKKINGSLILNSNPKLTDISSLSNIDAESIIRNEEDYGEEDLLIRYNFELSDCAIDNLCQFLDLSDKVVEIAHNAAGCNVVEEIQANCQGPPDCTNLTEPMAYAIDIPVNTLISWDDLGNAEGYFLYMGTQSGFYDLINGEMIIGQSFYQPDDFLLCDTTIYVKVVPFKGDLQNDSCDEVYFKTEKVVAEIVEDLVLCRGDSSELTVQGGDYYQWFPETALGSPDSSQTLVYPEKTTEYFCVVSNANGCTDTVSVIVNIEHIDILLDSITHFSSQQYGAIEIDILSEGKPYELSWSGPNGYIAETEDLYELEPGCYELTITFFDGNCETNKTYCIEDLTGMFEILKEGNYLSPNPSKDWTTLFLNNSAFKKAKMRVSIFDTKGLLVNQQDIFKLDKETGYRIDLRDISPGIYIVQLVDRKIGVISRKLLIW